MHAYVRNLYRELSRLVEPGRLAPYLFGHPEVKEPEYVESLGANLLSRVRYIWDRPRLRLLSRALNNAPRLVRAFDREVLLRVWRVLAGRHSPGGPSPLPDAPDLFHHIAFHVYPLHRVNVVTVPDLGALGEPGVHSEELKGLLEEGLPLAHWSDLVLTFSEHTRRDVSARLGLPLDRIRVTPLAAHARFRPACPQSQCAVRAKYNLIDRPYLLALGMLESRKNLPRLLEAFAMLRRAEPGLTHQLVLAGHQGWGAGDVFATIRRLGLQSEVNWLDFVAAEDLPALLSAADLLVHPSLYEGFGLPPLEAMACGTPVVAANSTSLPEVVGDAGLLADPFRPETFAMAMRRVLTDEGLRAELKRRGPEQARRFSWERTARLTLAAYQEAERLSREQPVSRPPRGVVRADRARAFWRPWVIDQVLRRTRERLGAD